ncbi:SNF-related serine/threonine-protein kinase-like [Limulus polyphemus]|uniref:SNF-related serine/threonine-protein kinase-like n=1 Tax=Limulus polyphemus TaxID=6850 RepID=A0ABM1BD12_LIMPO|nr:SNF-related serine/threonine-protein kinase-like [Limulus polyphemus]
MMSEGNSVIPSMQNIHHYNKYDGKIAGLYDLGDAIGRGHFAVVKLARHVFTGEKVAVKVIDKTKLDDVSRAHLFQEVRCMKLVQHPNVVRLYEVIDTHTKLYLILELGDGGDMYDYIMKHDKGVNEETARKFFQQIVHAISYCHRLHVVHRDLKPENVIFFEKLGMVKLTDFGFSNRYYPGQKLETSCGSLAYSAPEILLGDLYDAPKVDVWSMGVILYMLVCGHAPFQEANDSETLTMIMDCKYSLPSHVSKECSNLIASMLVRDPERRATLEEIANNSWLNSGDLIQPADYLPLISHEHLSEKDHALIIQKLVKGSIAAKEEILEALKKNEYNHITATYFLLAERSLRGQRQEKARRINRTSKGDLSPITSGNPSDFSPGQEKPNSVLESLISPRVVAKPLGSTNFLAPSSFSSTVAQNGQSYLPMARKCSVVCEEDDGSSSAKLLPPQASLPTKKDKSSIPVPRPTLPLFFHSRIKSATIKPKLSPILAFPNQKFKTLPSSGRGLHAVKSSPQLLLNEIDEEVASDTEPSTKTLGSKHSRKHFQSGKRSPHSVLSHAMFRLVGQRPKIGRSRTTSCSSSEASDDDGEGLKRKMGKLKSSGRRDSSEDRSGGQGEGCGGSGQSEPGAGTSHGNMSGGGGGGQSSVNNKSDGSKTNSNKSQSQQNEAVEESNLSIQPSSVNTTVLSTDSTDSLDIEQCLTCSVSCDDLLVNYTEDNQLTTSQDIKFQEESPEQNSLFPRQEDPSNLTLQESLSFTNPSSKVPLSLSVNSGFTLLQQIENLPLYSKNDSKSTRKDQGHRLKNITHGLTQLVHSATKFDISQNGWRERSRSKSMTRNIQSLRNERQVVVDTKLSSKCCTLC